MRSFIFTYVELFLSIDMRDTLCTRASPLSFYFFSFSLSFHSFSSIEQRRPRRAKKKKKRMKKRKGNWVSREGQEGKKDEEEAHSVRETGCGQLFTSWRMIPRGVPLRNESSSRINRQKGSSFQVRVLRNLNRDKSFSGKNFWKESMNITYVQLALLESL